MHFCATFSRTHRLPTLLLKNLRSLETLKIWKAFLLFAKIKELHDYQLLQKLALDPFYTESEETTEFN